MRRVIRRELVPERCYSCPLYAAKEQLVHPLIPTEICESTSIVFVGEAPGKEEDTQGVPFIGPAGQLLRKEIAKVTSHGYSFSNVVRCNPRDEGNRPPTEQEIACCHTYLLEDLAALQPKVVVLLGGCAIGVFKEFETVGSVRGKPFPVKYQINGIETEFTALPAYHPAYVLRNPNLINVLSQDIQRAYQLLLGTSGSQAKWSRKGTSTLLTSVAEVKDLTSFFMHEAPKDCGLAFDYETASLNRLKNVLATIGLSHDGDTGFVIPIQHTETPFSPVEAGTVVNLLQELFACSNPAFGYFIGHNVKFDMQIGTILGIGGKVGQISIPVPVICTQLMTHALDENRVSMQELGGAEGAYNLKVLAKEYLGFYHYNELATLASEGDMHLKPLSLVAEYQGMDAYVTHRLKDNLFERAEKQKFLTQMHNLAFHLQGPASKMLGSAEQRGIKLDTRQLYSLAGKNSAVNQEAERIVRDINKQPAVQKANDILLTRDGRTAGMTPLFGKPFIFDINVRDHQKVLYFEVEKLEPLDYGVRKDGSQGDAKLDKDFLEYYESSSSVIPLDQQRRGIKKLQEAYINSSLQRLDPYNGDPEVLLDGCIHTHFQQHRAVTGRLASKDPNMQQVPKPNKKIPWRTQVRKLFRAHPGKVLIQGDYSQAEVRWWVQLAKDHKYAEIFRKGIEIKRLYFDHCDTCTICGNEQELCPEGKILADRVIQECDPHRQAAALMHSIDPVQVSKEQRQGAKSFVFGSMYGRSVYTIADQIGCSVEEAQSIFDRFMSQFPKSAGWLTEIEEFAAANHYVESPFGRRRRLYAYLSGDRSQIAAANRQARNAPIQEAASSMNLLSACRIYQKILELGKANDWAVLALIHDSIIVEVPFEEMEEAIYMMEGIMLDEQALKNLFGIELIVPMECEFEVGTNLGETYTWGIGEDSMWNLKKRLTPQVEAMREL